MYSANDVTQALRAVGVREGDTLYLSTQLFGLGPMAGATDSKSLCQGIYDGILGCIGASGTLVVPTYTQQVGRYGLPYIHEETASLTGIFGEFVRLLPGARRSLHPVFSVSAIGPKARVLTDDTSPVGFGFDSPFSRMERHGGKAVCIGFPYYSGHIVTMTHYVETIFSVPYYYNKIVQSEVFMGGLLVEKTFVINVKYSGTGAGFYFNRYIDRLQELGEITTSRLGRGMVYAVDIPRHIAIGVDMLREDMFAFLDRRPIEVVRGI